MVGQDCDPEPVRGFGSSRRSALSCRLVRQIRGENGGHGVDWRLLDSRLRDSSHGFEFLGYKIQRGKGRFRLTRDRIKSKLNRQNLYAIPTQKSVDRFKDPIRALTQRKIPLRLGELIETINPIVRGWGNYYCRSHIRKRFHQISWMVG